MAWAEKRPNGRYRAAWRDQNGNPQFSRSIYLTRRAAEQAGWDEEDRARRRVPTHGDGLTWSQWSTSWLPARERAVSRSTFASDRYRVATYLMPYWGTVRLPSITTRDVKVWVAELVTQHPVPTVHKALWLFSASLRDAVELEHIDHNPCHGVKPPRADDWHERFFTPEEIDAVCRWLNPPYGTAVRLLCETGLRFGELAGLHWQHVELAAHRIEVSVAWSRAGRVMTPTKGRNRRSVPISALAEDLLRRLPRTSTSCGRTHEGTAACRSGLVLPGPQGAPLDSRNARTRHWLPALKLAGLDHARQHDLRHTFASWAVQAGVPLSDVAEALGHSDSYVTRRYAHLAGSHLGRIRTALDGMREHDVRIDEPPAPDLPPVIDLSEQRSQRRARNH